MSRSRPRILRSCKESIERRLQPVPWTVQTEPMLSAANLHYEMADRARAIPCGGIGLMLRMALQLGLRELIDTQLRIFKDRRPYFESDHIFSIVMNLLAGGTCLEDIELRRNDENYLNALGAQRVPDPTTAGDFCRRFDQADVENLLRIINEVRLEVWKRQPRAFFDEAILDVDASIVETLGRCKEGADFSHDKKFGYQVLVVSLANTGELLHLSVRSGNRPSHEGAAQALREITRFCKRAGFREVTIRGDTDYSMTHEFDPWNEDDSRFVVGYDALPKVVRIASELPESQWRLLERRDKNPVKTDPRSRPENVRERIVVEREYKNFNLQREDLAEFTYRPIACGRPYRMVVVRKTILVTKGQAIIDGAEQRYFFYATNDWIAPAESIVFDANDRCNQENLFSQLGAAGILQAPLGDLLSNWAYMVIASLAWTLKAWFALLLPDGGRWAGRRRGEKNRVLKMKFRTFLNAFMLVPAQVVRSGRRLVYRILSWNPWRAVFFRAWDSVQALRC